jgi:hypothetical protein
MLRNLRKAGLFLRNRDIDRDEVVTRIPASRPIQVSERDGVRGLMTSSVLTSAWLPAAP